MNYNVFMGYHRATGFVTKRGIGMAGEKILVVDDEEEIRDLIGLYLSQNGFQVTATGNGLEAIQLAAAEKPDLIILDILLPGLDGIEVCQELRRNSSIPVLFLSCKGDEADKILGLTVGGDDYITKPFSPAELLARVKAHLRRSRLIGESDPQGKKLLKFPGLLIDLDSHVVLVEGSPVILSAKEFQILSLLARNKNRVFGLDQIFGSLWGTPDIGDTRTVMVHISNLRKKIEKDPSSPVYIQTIRGVGYRFTPGK